MGSDDARDIREDLHRLAGSLPHRGSNTESEREAAAYILGRMQEAVPDARLDEFESLDGSSVLYALYCTEYVVVGILTIWFPWLAAGYGTALLAAFLAELTGYRLLSRLAGLYESQNVAGRILAARPRRQIVVTAHYDTGRTTRLTGSGAVRWLRLRALSVVSAMFAATGAAVFRTANVFPEGTVPYDLIVQWAAIGYLGAAGGYLVFAQSRSAPIRGALGNASGVAAMLRLARRFAAAPLEETDLWFIATGSKEGGLNGMRHALKSGEFDRRDTWILNLDYVGEAQLRYVAGEGLLQTFPSAPAWIRAAEEAGGAAPYVHRGMPTDLLPALAKGFPAMGVTSTDAEGEQRHRLQPSDTLAAVDDGAVVRAADFAEAAIRRLDAALSAADRPRL